MFNTTVSSDIRQTLEHFRRSVDRLFDDFYTTPGRSTSETSATREYTFSPAFESAWSEHELLLRAVLPGVPEKNVKVNVQGNQLVLEGERPLPEGFDRNAFTHLNYGNFYTAVTLPNGLNLDGIKCRLHDGVLDIYLPVAEEMKPRRIRIETGEGQKAISA